MRIWTLAALLLTASARGNGFMAPQRRSPAAAADAGLCAGLQQSDDRLRTAFAKGSTFPDDVYAAFAGQGSGDATAGDYMTRGSDLFQLVDTVSAQCRTTLGAEAEVVAAPIRRRAQAAKRAADVYLDLPRSIARIDAEENPAGMATRSQFLTAMYKIADGGNFDAAATLADAAHAALSRLQR